MDRWIVILGGEVPEAYGLYGSEELAERAADRWNAEHPDDEYSAQAQRLNPARDLSHAN